MIQLQRQIIDDINHVKEVGELHVYLQKAIELEHSTIPPYLTAMFSLKSGVNTEIANLIRSVVIEEMLHMSISANILIAIGGHPQINIKGFVPDYPGPLPMNIGNGLQVGIEAFSISLVQNTFMAIEEPEDPIPVRKTMNLLEAALPDFATIGQFYDAIEQKIRQLGPKIFTQTGAPPQVVNNHWFPADKLFAIVDPESACRGIDIIKREGEGTKKSPFAADEVAHYYKFGEIAAGRRLQKTATGYAYSGKPILFDPAGIWPLKANCKIADFPVGTQARTRITQFAYNYSALLNALHQAFNGHPERLNAAIGLMYDLRVLSAALMQTDALDGTGLTVGPSYEYVAAEGGAPA